MKAFITMHGNLALFASTLQECETLDQCFFLSSTPPVPWPEHLHTTPSPVGNKLGHLVWNRDAVGQAEFDLVYAMEWGTGPRMAAEFIPPFLQWPVAGTPPFPTHGLTLEITSHGNLALLASTVQACEELRLVVKAGSFGKPQQAHTAPNPVGNTLGWRMHHQAQQRFGLVYAAEWGYGTPLSPEFLRPICWLPPQAPGTEHASSKTPVGGLQALDQGQSAAESTSAAAPHQSLQAPADAAFHADQPTSTPRSLLTSHPPVVAACGRGEEGASQEANGHSGFAQAPASLAHAARAGATL